MYICIEGNIGSGKSTLAAALAKKLKARFLPERFEENTLLPLFYKDPETFAFPVEYAFLIDRQKQMTQHFAQKPVHTVSDYSIEKCLYFAEINLGRKDYKFYKKHFNAIRATVPLPDLIVHISAPEKLLLRNIRKRARTYEQGITEKYLRRISQAYRKSLARDTRVPVHTIQVKTYNAQTTGRCVTDICEAISRLGLK